MLYYASTVSSEGSDIERYFLAGRYDAAAVLAAYGIQDFSRLLVAQNIEDSLYHSRDIANAINYRQNVMAKLLGSRFIDMLDLQPHLDTLEGRAVQRTLVQKNIFIKDGQYVIKNGSFN